MSAKSSSGAGKHPYVRDDFRGTEAIRKTFAEIRKGSLFPTLPLEPWTECINANNDAIQRKGNSKEVLSDD